MSIDRRSFIRLVGAGAVGLVAGKAQAAHDEGSASSQDSQGVLVDTTQCIACRKCEAGCNKANSLSAHDAAFFEDKSVLLHHRRPVADAFTVVNQIHPVPGDDAQVNAKVQCMHCIDPACASACIVGALRKDARGPVTYDAWKCIGCRYCMVACPFQIPAYEYSDALAPRVRKCTFCFERTIEQGKRPACVEACPNESLTFAKRGELLELAHQKIASKPERYTDHVYGEKEAGGTSWLYLAKIDFTKLDLPALGERPMPALTETIQHNVFKGFVPPLALYGLLGLIYLSRRGDTKGDSHE